MSFLPISVEPVNVSFRTMGFEVSSPPITVAAENSRRDAGAMGELGHGERGVGRLRGRLADEGAARGERGPGLAGDHGGRKIPGRDRRDDADRLSQHEDALVGLMSRDHVAVDPLALFGEPLDEGGRISDLALRLGKRLALLGRHQLREVVGIREHEVVPAPEDRRAVLRRAGGPGREGGLCRFDGATGLGDADNRDRADQLAGGGIYDLVRAAALGVDPLAVDVALLAKEILVLEIESHVSVLADSDPHPPCGHPLPALPGEGWGAGN